MAPADVEFDTSGAEMSRAKGELGDVVALATRDFAAGDLVFREKVLVMAAVENTNLARVRAYCALPDDERQKIREDFFGEEPEIRCAATAFMRLEAAGSGDSAGEVARALRDEGHDELDIAEVEQVIRVWNLNAWNRALAPLACKVSHLCAPNVTVNVDTGRSAIEVTACRGISKGDVLGGWYFQDTGLWWMGADVRRSIFETQRGFGCACDRCLGPDVCRAVPCGKCADGLIVPDGVLPGAKEAPTWRCSSCGRQGPGDAVALTAEADLNARVLLELKPTKGRAPPTADVLLALEMETRQRLGYHHWVAGAAALLLHMRVRPPGGRLDAFSTASGVRFLGWLLGRGLPTPAATIVRTPISIAVDCSSWMTGTGLASSSASRAQSGDHRCIAARVLSQFLLPIFNASGSALGNIANIGDRVGELGTWLTALRNTCGCCGKALAAPGAEVGEGAAKPLGCGRCKQLRYCSKECQTQDWKTRHKAGCLPVKESLSSDVIVQMLLVADPESRSGVAVASAAAAVAAAAAAQKPKAEPDEPRIEEEED